MKSEIQNKNGKYSAKKVKIFLIPLSEAAKLSGYTAQHLNLMCRRGVLRGKKVGRNWHTTKAWLDEFLLSPNQDGKKYQRRKNTTVENLVPEEFSLLADENNLERMAENISEKPKPVFVKLEDDSENLKYLLKEKEQEVEKLESLKVETKFGIVKIFQSITTAAIATLLIFAGLNVFQKVFDRMTLNVKDIPADITRDTFLSLDENGIVKGEEISQDITEAQQRGIILASENFRAQDINIGGDVILATSDDNQALEVSDIKSETFVTKAGDTAKLMISWRTNKMAASELAYSKNGAQSTKTISENTYGFSHVAILSELEPKTSYVYSIKTKDRWGNAEDSGYFGIYTASRPVSVFDMIAKALGDVFSWTGKK